MNGGISSWFIRNPIATSLVMIGVLFVGGVVYPRLPVAPLPQVDFPTIQVSASLPGASPDTMASAVAPPPPRPYTKLQYINEPTPPQQSSKAPAVPRSPTGGHKKPAPPIQLAPATPVAKVLSFEDARTPLSVTTVDNPKGTIMGPTRSFTIYTNDQLIQSKDWNDVVVAYRNGAPLRVRDIGQAVTGPQNTTQAPWADR